MLAALLSAVALQAAVAASVEDVRGPEDFALAIGSNGSADVVNATEVDWLALGRSIKIYVYELPADLLEVKEEDRNHNYYFEVVFAKLLSASRAHRVFQPEQADFFFVPIEAAAYWYHVKRTTGRGLSIAERPVLEYLRSVGPFWDERQERHIVPSLRCPVKSGMETSIWRPTFDHLWEGRALMLCLLATKETVDTRRALHVGYYTPDMSVDDELPSDTSGRDILAVYIGAPINHYRVSAAHWMQHNCSDCRVYDVQDHSNASESMLTEYHATLKRAKFAIEPPGDTLERMSRDASILAGVIPVIFEYTEGTSFSRQYLPWSPVLDWSSFSVNFTLELKEMASVSNFMPRLERKLRDLVASGEANRLYAGLRRAQQRLRWSEEGVVATLAGMLAQKKALYPECGSSEAKERGEEHGKPDSAAASSHQRKDDGHEHRRRRGSGR